MTPLYHGCNMFFHLMEKLNYSSLQHLPSSASLYDPERCSHYSITQALNAGKRWKRHHNEWWIFPCFCIPYCRFKCNMWQWGRKKAETLSSQAVSTLWVDPENIKRTSPLSTLWLPCPNPWRLRLESLFELKWRTFQSNITTPNVFNVKEQWSQNTVKMENIY